MRKIALAAGMALALVVPLPAIAADLHDPHTGGTRACDDGEVGTWHFVNNQTRGATTGSLKATFESGAVTVSPGKLDGSNGVNRNTMHFWVVAEGDVLLDATTFGLPGRLVLSEFYCEEVKKKGTS